MKQMQIQINAKKILRTSLVAFVLSVGVLIAYGTNFKISEASSASTLINTKPTGYVTDDANLLSADQKSALETAIQAHKEKTGGANGGDEIAVVTIKTLDGDSLENFANTLFNAWGIGDAKKNNGVLLLVALAERKIRIEVGYGLEGTLTDLQTFKISDGIMKPLFREGKYGEGIIEGTSALIQTILGDETQEDTGILNDATYEDIESSLQNINLSEEIDTATLFDSKKFIFEFMYIVILIIIFGITAATLFPFAIYKLAKTKSWWGGGFIFGVITILISLLVWRTFPNIFTLIQNIALGLIFDYVFSKANRNEDGNLSYAEWRKKHNAGSGGSGGRSSSSSRSSSSRSSFGGGSSGGGGSSSSW